MALRTLLLGDMSRDG